MSDDALNISSLHKKTLEMQQLGPKGHLSQFTILQKPSEGSLKSQCIDYATFNIRAMSRIRPFESLDKARKKEKESVEKEGEEIEEVVEVQKIEETSSRYHRQNQEFHQEDLLLL